MRCWRRASVAAALVLVCALVPGLSRAGQTAELTVVATLKPIHSLVAGVMAGAGTPKLLIDGTGSPHAFTLKPSDVGR